MVKDEAKENAVYEKNIKKQKLRAAQAKENICMNGAPYPLS